MLSLNFKFKSIWLQIIINKMEKSSTRAIEKAPAYERSPDEPVPTLEELINLETNNINELCKIEKRIFEEEGKYMKETVSFGKYYKISNDFLRQCVQGLGCSNH